MSNLRTKVIKLAQQKPELRPVLLPLLRPILSDNFHQSLTKLGTTNPELRPHIRPLLKASFDQSDIPGFDTNDDEYTPDQTYDAQLDISKALGGGLDEARLLSSYVKPSGTHGIDPRISYWKNKGWAVVTQAASKSDAVRLGRRIQNNLVAPSKLHYSDPYVHTLPLFVIYNGGEWVRIDPIVKHMGSVTKTSSIKPITALSSDQQKFIKDVNKSIADEFRKAKLEGWTIKLVSLWTSDLNQQADAAKLKHDGFGGKSIMVGVPHALVVWEMNGTVKGTDVGRFTASILLSQDAESAVIDKIKKETFPHANPKTLGEKIVQGFLGVYQDVAEQQRREERVREKAKSREEARALNDALEAKEKEKGKEKTMTKGDWVAVQETAYKQIEGRLAALHVKLTWSDWYGSMQFELEGHLAVVVSKPNYTYGEGLKITLVGSGTTFWVRVPVPTPLTELVNKWVDAIHKAVKDQPKKAVEPPKKVVEPPKRVDQGDAKDTIALVSKFLKELDYGPAGYATFVQHNKNDKAFYITTTKDTAQNEWYVDEDEDDDTTREEASWEMAYKSRVISLVQRALNREFGGGVLTVDVDRTGAVTVDYATLDSIKIR